MISILPTHSKARVGQVIGMLLQVVLEMLEDNIDTARMILAGVTAEGLKGDVNMFEVCLYA